MSKKKNKIGFVNQQRIQTVKEPKITDSKNDNVFGMMFHTLKSMEAFQLNSGMSGKYTKEYQHHYWTIVGRIHTGGQILDVAFPLVMFNYPQVISSGDIKFKLTDVSAASEKTLPLVKEKFEEFKKTLVYNELSEVYGIKDWSFHAGNTCHVHPGRMATFSGIDLRKEYGYPGVVFPLSTGTQAPSFSGIICHVDNKAEMVRNEYRNFSGKIGEDKEYLYGRCITYIKSYTPKPLPEIEQPDPVEAGPIDELFGIIPKQPAKKTHPKQKEIKSFVLKDNLLANQGDNLSKQIAMLWEQDNFEPDTSQIFEENLTESRPVVVTRQYNMFEKDEESWFDRHYATHRNKSKQKNARGGEEDNDLTIFDKKQVIAASGQMAWNELYKASIPEIEKLYKEIIDKKSKKSKFKVNGYTEDEVTKIRSLLVAEEYLSPAKLVHMSNENVTAYYDQFYVVD